ncbi:LPS export ABC transporter periplasmic protein LptC [Chryseolinea sp. T2]|uniref:LPS export ABC transporter periplasmic protein LptC n=1 Tax=Chryseolinea sp. T2 TaxID=3129255 RepID=UPI003077DA7D
MRPFMLSLRFKRVLSFTLVSLAASLVFACNNPENKEPVEYKGPLSEAENVELFFSEKERVKIRMTAPLLYEFQNGDREFPKGVFIEMFNENGKVYATLRANHAYFFKSEEHWRGRGNVELKNLEKQQQLNTEELFWKPKDQKIYTEKFVTIRQDGDVLYGEGLTANEDLSEYVITRPSGDMEIQE